MLYIKKKGSVGYTIVGTPTIVDGVASGFSLIDYCLVNTPFAPGNYSWEEEICFKLDYPGSSINMALCNSTLKDFVFPKITVITASSSTINIQPCLSGNGTGWNIHQAVLTGVQFDYSKKGYVKIVYSPATDSSGTYTYLFRQEGDASYRVLSADTNKPVIYQDANDPGFSIGADIGAGAQWNSYFRGKIYLEETYFKINGQPWFGICSVEVKKHQIKGPVGYTVIGTPTIIDNIMSNFSNSNYATTTSAFEVANYENVEIYVRAKTPATISSGWTDIIENGGLGSYRNLGAYANSALTSYYFNFFGHDFWRYQISEDTWYRLKLTTTADTQSGYIYDDNGNLLYQSNDARRIAGTSVLSFGGRYSPNKIGAIDLNNTYIKVNGKMWFYQPANTKYIVKDGKLVWSDPSIYLQSDGNQYIDTGIIFKANTVFEVDAFFDNMNDNRWSGGTNYIIATNTNRFPTNISGRWYDSYTQAVTSGKHNILLSIASSSFQLIVDNIIQQDISTTLLDDGSTFCIGKAHNGARGGLSGKSYGYKIFQNNVLARHFVPVPAGLVIGNFTVPSNGMFDIVNQQFYANQGTGEFTIGRDE